MNPNPAYSSWIAEWSEWARRGRALPLGGFAPPPRARPAADAPVALLLSPHPDDECITGAWPLRLGRAGWRVINVAVTQGSRKDRQAGRLEELRRACAYLGWEVVATAPGGLEKINLKGRADDAENWASAARVIGRIILETGPAAIFAPHAADWNGTHIGVHHLLMEALRDPACGWRGRVVETEFWGAHPAPNLMVQSAAADVAELVAALSFHVEEVRRNPYHLTLPAWMMDNVRRGGELVGGQGGAAPDYDFATLYRVNIWDGAQRTAPWSGGRALPADADPAAPLGAEKN